MNKEIRFLKNSQIDYSKWDEVVDLSPQGKIYYYSWYLDLIHPYWNACVLGDYEMVFPVLDKKKFLISYVITPIFIQESGVIAKDDNKVEVSSFVRCLSHSQSIQYMNLFLSPGNYLNQSKNFKIHFRKAQQISLNQTYDSIYTSYSNHLKRNLRKANKNKLKLVYDENGDSVVDFFKLNRGGQLKELSEIHFVILKKLFKTIIDNNKGKVISVYHNDVLIANAFFIFSNNQVIYFKGSSNKIGRNLSAMHFLMDEVIKSNVSKSNFFDFGGSNIDSIARFNYNFGAEDYSYPVYKENRLPFFLKWIKP